MFRSYRIGHLFGFGVDVNLSFLLMLGLMLFWGGLVTGLVFVLVAFSAVLLHELGHALVARHLGVRVVGIELHFFGGAAKMMGQPKSAGDEIAIAAAGPAVSFALGGLGIVAAAMTGVGIVFGSRLGRRWGFWAEIAGGCVLLGIGVRILVTHLG